MMAHLTQPVSTEDHTRGPDDAPVTLVEYGDFECPHCGAAFPVVRDVIQRAGDRVRFVYRHFPLTESHPHAQQAAEAAEAAGAQGRFWEMHNQLFQNQDRLDEDSLRSYAAEIGLDLERFDREMQERTYQQDVREEFRSGVRSGVNGTPTFFINGERYEGPFDVKNLYHAVEWAESRV